MSLYVDSSALLKRYVDEPESETCERYLLADPVWITGRHTYVEVRRNLCRMLAPLDLDAARADFAVHWARTKIVELDPVTCDLAAQLAEATGVRTLDALHLAAARRVGGSDIAVLTLDHRLRDAAQALGMPTPG